MSTGGPTPSYPIYSFPAIIWGEVITDAPGMFDGFQPERLTVPEAGVYMVKCSVAWSNPAELTVEYAEFQGTRTVEIWTGDDVNTYAHNADVRQAAVGYGFNGTDLLTIQQVSTIQAHPAGQFFRCGIYQNSSEVLDYVATLEIVRIQ